MLTGQVGAGLAAKITAKTKAKAKKHLFKPAMVIVNEMLMEEITDAPCPSLPKPVNLAKAANYMRQDCAHQIQRVWTSSWTRTIYPRDSCVEMSR